MSMHLELAFLSVLLMSGGSAATQNAGSSSHGSFETEHAQLAAAAVVRLGRVADWCHERQLYRQRDAAYRAILKFEPDHPAARKFLKYRRAKDGQWIDTGAYREPRERQSLDLLEYERMHKDLVTDLGRQVVELLEHHAGSISGSDRRALVETLLELDPDNTSAHAELGEVRDPAGAAWILVESASTRKRHAELAELAERLVKDAPKFAAAEAAPPESELGLEWRSVLRTDRVRLFSTVPGSLPEECARLAEAVLVLFDATLRPEARSTSGFTIYLLASANDKTRLLAEHAAVGPARAAEYRHFDSFWIGGREMVVCALLPKDQLDQIVNQTITRKLTDHFGVSFREGLVHAGVTSYLAGLFDAARSSGSVSAVSHAGHEALGRPDFELTLRKPYQELSKEEEAAGRLLLGYLIEGWPESAPHVLRRVGSGVPFDQSLHELLGFDLETVLERLARRDREIRTVE